MLSGLREPGAGRARSDGRRGEINQARVQENFWHWNRRMDRMMKKTTWLEQWKNFKGFHHFYLGVMLIILAFLLVWINWFLAIILFFVGIVLIVDDFYQHVRQQVDPDYQSPLHRWYVKYLWEKYAWIRRLNEWIDELFS